MSDNNDWAARRAANKTARKKNAVLKYLVILFAAAFILLLYSYIAQQRSNKSAIENLEQTSNSAVQTLDNIIKERDDLKEQVSEQLSENASLHYDLKEAQEDAAESKRKADALQAQKDSLLQLNELRTAYNKKHYNDARAMLDQWESENPGLMEHTLEIITNELIDEGRDDYNPLKSYQNIVHRLGWEAK